MISWSLNSHRRNQEVRGRGCECTPMAKIPRNFAQFVGWRFCYYKHYAPSPFCNGSSGVTRVSVTRGGNWWCQPIFIFFLEKNWRLFSHHPLENDDFFSCRLLTTPISHVVYQFLFLNSAATKVFLFGCQPPSRMVSPGAVRPHPPNDATGTDAITVLPTR